MKGRVAKELRKIVYGERSKRNKGAVWISGRLTADKLRSDYQHLKKVYRNKKKSKGAKGGDRMR